MGAAGAEFWVGTVWRGEVEPHDWHAGINQLSGVRGSRRSFLHSSVEPSC